MRHSERRVQSTQPDQPQPQVDPAAAGSRPGDRIPNAQPGSEVDEAGLVDPRKIDPEILTPGTGRETVKTDPDGSGRDDTRITSAEATDPGAIVDPRHNPADPLDPTNEPS